MLTNKQRSERNDAIYASDIFPLLDGNSARAEVILTKAGIIQPKNLDGVIAIQAGNRLESAVIDWARERLGTITTPTDTFSCAACGNFKGHVDGLLFGQRAGLEAKVVGPGMASEYGAEGTEEVPDKVYLQCQSYMTILDYNTWYVAALINSTSFGIYQIQRDETLGKLIVSVARKAWASVQACRETPEPWLNQLDESSETGRDALKRIRRKDTKSVIRLDSMNGTMERRAELGKQIAELTKEREEINAKIRKSIGLFDMGILPDGTEISIKDVQVKARDSYSYSKMTIKQVKETSK